MAEWGVDALWRQLEPLLPGLNVEVVARTESTNTRLLERARASAGQRDAPITRPGEIDAEAPVNSAGARFGRRAGDLEPCLLVAEQQTRGRGRLGRHWLSATGASLTFSLSLPLAPRDWAGLSLAVGVALADALDPARADALPRIGLKWPNDLWLLDHGCAEGAAAPGRKLGGVLIETVAVGKRRICVVGVGLNVLAQPVPATLSNGYACLHEIDPAASAQRALAVVAPGLARALLRFQADGFQTFTADYARRDLLAGRAIVATGAQALEGVADGVDAHGGLRVLVDGQEQLLVSGEVSVRLADRGAC